MAEKHMKLNNILNILYQDIDNAIEKYDLRNQTTYIWGVSRPSYAGLQYLAHKGVMVKNVIDNNRLVKGELPMAFAGYCEWEEPYRVPVIWGGEIENNLEGNSYFLIFSRFFEDIRSQLNSYGINPSHVIELYNPTQLYTIPKSEIQNDGRYHEISVDERKAIQLDILFHFADMCEKNKLNYFLGAGTCLGAVRHKGYIPWDDDIDVYMPAPDFYRMVELNGNGTVSEGNYNLLFHGITDNYTWRFAKYERSDTLQFTVRWPLINYSGINIDIFPVSGIPNDEAERKFFEKEVFDFFYKWDQEFVKFGTEYATQTDWEKAFEDIYKKYDYKSSKDIGWLEPGNPYREIVNGEKARMYIEMEYEGRMLKVISNYDELLTKMYGDYMTPPPENIRLSGSHDIIAYICE